MFLSEIYNIIDKNVYNAYSLNLLIRENAYSLAKRKAVKSGFLRFFGLFVSLL